MIFVLLPMPVCLKKKKKKMREESEGERTIRAYLWGMYNLKVFESC